MRRKVGYQPTACNAVRRIREAHEFSKHRGSPGRIIESSDINAHRMEPQRHRSQVPAHRVMASCPRATKRPQLVVRSPDSNYDHRPENTGESWMRLCHTFRNSMTGRIAPAHPWLAAIVLLGDQHLYCCYSRRHQRSARGQHHQPLVCGAVASFSAIFHRGGDRLAIDGGVPRQGGHGLANQRVTLGSVVSTPGEQAHAIAVTAGDQPVAIVLDLVNPLRADRRLGRKRRDAGIDKALRAATSRRTTQKHSRDILRHTQTKGLIALRRD